MNTVDAQGVVSLTGGLLRGGREEGVSVFRGVPFAQPPVGGLRFRAPRPVEPWTGVRDATRSSSASYQVNHVNQGVVGRVVREIDPGVPGVIAGPLSVFTTYCHNDISEDCLYLDIWVPDAARHRELPVFVYYHGGANIVSSGSFALERAAALAREGGLIVVRPNYRLGALGWVHFGLLDAGTPEAVNLGVQDQFAALRWVHENVAAFGGDPGNVTIGGESAGATAVSHLLANPAAHPYFRRAVLQSFSPFNPWCTQQPEEAAFVARRFLELLEVRTADELREIDPDRLLAAQSVLARQFPADAHVAWRPQGAVVDGASVPVLPALHLAEDRIGKPDLEVVIGFAKDEWQFFRGHTATVQDGTAEDVQAVLGEVFGETGAVGLYRSHQRRHPGRAPGSLLSDIMSFEFFKLPSLAIAHNLAAQGIAVRLFQFSCDLPGLDGRFGATHTGDMPFLWRNHSPRDLAAWPFFEGVSNAGLERWQEEIARLGAEFGELYAGFIRTGDPGPAWPEFDPRTETVLWFGCKIESRPGLLTPERDVYRDLGYDQPRSLEDALVANVRARLS